MTIRVQHPLCTHLEIIELKEYTVSKTNKKEMFYDVIMRSGEKNGTQAIITPELLKVITCTP